MCDEMDEMARGCFPTPHRAADLTHLRWLEKSQWPNASWPGNKLENERKVRNPNFLPRRLLLSPSKVHVPPLVSASFRLGEHDVAGPIPKAARKSSTARPAIAAGSHFHPCERQVGGGYCACTTDNCSARLFSSVSRPPPSLRVRLPCGVWVHAPIARAQQRTAAQQHNPLSWQGTARRAPSRPSEKESGVENTPQ